MIIRAKQHKNLCYGYIVEVITEDNGYGRVRNYWDLLQPNEDEPILFAEFKSFTEAKNYAKKFPFRG